MADPVLAQLAALKPRPLPPSSRNGAICSRASRRPTTGASSKAGWPIASRNSPLAASARKPSNAWMPSPTSLRAKAQSAAAACRTARSLERV